jgi:hypothetical protein
LAANTKQESVKIPSMIILNVGGMKYETSLETLQLAGKGSYFDTIFSDNWRLNLKEDGTFFIDR